MDPIRNPVESWADKIKTVLSITDKHQYRVRGTMKRMKTTTKSLRAALVRKKKTRADKSTIKQTEQKMK